MFLANIRKKGGLSLFILGVSRIKPLKNTYKTYIFNEQLLITYFP